MCFICLCFLFFDNCVTEYRAIISYIILFPFNFFFSNLTFFLMLDLIARKRSRKYRTIFRNFIYSITCLLILPQSPLQKYTTADPTTEHFRLNNKNSETLQQNPNVQINSLNKIIRSLIVVYLKILITIKRIVFHRTEISLLSALITIYIINNY